MLFGSQAHDGPRPHFQAICLQFLAGLASLSYANAAELDTRSDVDPAALCLSLPSKLSYENLTTTYLPAGSSFTVPAADRVGCEGAFPSWTFTTHTSICRVEVTVPTSSRSRVKVEAWLPDSTSWHGRLLSLGNGGLAGCFLYDELIKTSGQLGMATIQTDNGHQGNTALPMRNNEEVLIDFAWRSLEVEYHTGMAITEAYYGKKPDYKYYNGCSMGGRQGFYLAQEFPDFYDGIVAGAPGLDFITLSAYFLKIAKLTGVKSVPDTNTDFVIGAVDLPVITQGVLDQCDGKNGDLLKDGIIEDPDKCNFKPEKVQCSKKQLESGNTKGVCLTAKQVAVVKEIFQPLKDENGKVIYSRWEPGMTSSLPLLFEYFLAWSVGMDIFQNLIYNTTSFSLENFSDADITFARSLPLANMATWNTNLTPFKKSGGKLLSYHGTADGIIPSGIVLRYHSEVSETISPHDPSSFWKHFVIPGMDHCISSTGGTNAPWNFGQFNAPLAGLQNDSDHSIIWTLIDWVEGKGKSGKGPETIVGTKFVGDNAENGVLAQRTYCAYPKKSVLKKKGLDSTKADNWKCV